ncbi:MAG TPA: AMP-binding protein [Acidimicrobiia bacterium]|nr:AMP-binding protein [Acidimicrobiia bacterium]
MRATYDHPRAADYRKPSGPWDIPSLDELLTHAGRLARDDVVVDPSAGVRFDAEQLEDLVARVAGGLRGAGVRRGDVVAWQAPNWYEAIVLYRACWRIAAVAAPVHHLAGPSDVDRMLAQVDPKLVLGRDDVRGPSSRFEELAQGAPFAVSAARPSDLAVVLFTSGSTGGPKAVMHSQRSLAYKGRVMARCHALTMHDSILMPAPLAHVSGLLNAVLIPGLVPMKAVLMDRWSPDASVDAIERERVTFMIGPPTFFVGLLGADRFRPAAVESLRLVSSGGAGVTPAFVADASQRLGARVKRTYGSTEAPTVTTSTVNDPDDRARETDGRSTGGAELRVTDPATGREVRHGDSGELWLRGPELFVGYTDAKQTRDAITRGWFRTGDLATVDRDGWLTIVGRMKDIIIRGGENIAAAEVEGVLESHPSVRQAVAVGYPDDRLGERVCAFVVSDGELTLDDARAWFEQRGVARFKTPERVVRVDEMPVLAAGKVDRTALRDRARQSP